MFERQDWSKPKPDFDWDDLDRNFAPTLPENGISIKDLQDHFKVKASRAQQIAREAREKGLLKRIGKGWYIKP